MVLTTTENGSLTYATSLSLCLDYYFQVLQGTDAETNHTKIALAWKESPETVLKLIFQLRDIRGGKCARYEGLDALYWLYQEHLETFLANLDKIAAYGCYRDLLKLVEMAINNGEIIFEAKKDTKEVFAELGRSRLYAETDGHWLAGSAFHKDEKPPVEKNRAEFRAVVNSFSEAAGSKEKEARRKFAAALLKAQREEVSENREEKKMAKREALQKSLKDEKFVRLYEAVASLFAEQLAKDLDSLKEEKPVSLAAKWAPSPKSSIDKNTKLAFAIAKKMFPQGEGEKDADKYKARALHSYQKQVLAPLRKATEVTETYMCAGHWQSIPYSAVPSVCMTKNNKHFKEHDKERFEAYLESVERGEASIKSGALLPHEIVASAHNKVSQLQWADYVKDLQKTGLMDGALAVCDVSGSMSGIPMQVAIALSLLVALLTKPPFKNLIISFSEKPSLFRVPDEPLDSQVSFIKQMDWGMSTNFQAVFDLILDLAKKHKTPQKDMIKTLFVFSDMEFNEAFPEQKATDHEIIQGKFKEAGYEMPSMVYWNLRGDRYSVSTPVLKNEQGVAMLSGFSGKLLRQFLNNGDLSCSDPESLMVDALQKYSDLKLVD